ncbi:MAG: carbohydrate binding domain-containing protein [Oscillospiraceae bacterium]|nr:carbohydrate binding domain-containing protein [Oscillospiraceae bacterium]
MQLRKMIRRFCAAAVSGFMLATMTAALPMTTTAAGTCTINTNKTYQRIRGFGGMNLPEWQGYDLTDAQIQTVFGNGDGQLGLTVLRIYVSDDSNAWSKVIPTAKAAQKLGATIFATPWNPPSSMRKAGSGGTNGGKYVLNDNAEAQYATHLNNYIKYVESQGVNLYSVSVQNEPNYSTDWTYWSPDRTTNFIANYGQAVKAGTNAKLMSPETFQYGAWGNGRDYYNKILNNSKALANIDLFGTHFYGTPREKMDFPALENSGKEIWMTEVYVPNSDSNSANRFPEAIQVAENIHNGLVVGNMSAYVWWYIRRSYSLIGQDDGQPTKRGYMMAQYSKYVRPGDIRIDATESPDSNLLISAYKHSDTQIEIVAVNKGTTDVTQQFSVDGRTITNVDRYRTGASENLAKTENMEHDTSSYWATLPGNTVSTFVVTLTSDGKAVPEDPNAPVPQEPITPDANGYYYHDTFEESNNSWEARGGTELTLSGRHPYEGTNALLVQNREKAWQGVQKALDTITFKAGEKFSFSVCVDYEEGESEQEFMLSMQYTDASGETKYAHIADGTAYPGQYLQLENTSFQIPDGASSPILYVETADGTANFYIDEAIVAKDGTKINGPGQPEPPATEPPVTEPPVTEPPVTEPPVTETPVTEPPMTEPPVTQPVVTEAQPQSDNVLYGDANDDKHVDILDVITLNRNLQSGEQLSEQGKRNADVDRNGAINETDSLNILKYLVDLIDALPVDA